MDFSTDTHNASQVKKLAEEFRTRNLDTKIVIYGHNWDNLQYARDILSDPEVRFG